MDKSLQQRAGLNVGTEPLGWVIDKALQNKYTVQQGSEVAILQHSSNNNRLVPGKVKPGQYIYGFNKGSVPVTFQAKWHNEFGESIDLEPFPNTLPTAGSDVTLIGFEKFGNPLGEYQLTGWMTLAPEEKITIRTLDGDATFFVPVLDIKRKPLPSGGGGQSDGNVVTVRATVTSQGVIVGPPPGKAWAGLPVAGLIRMSTKVGHFGALTDTPVNIAEYLIDEHNNEYCLVNTFNPVFDNVQPQTFKSCGASLLSVSVGILAYPNKWKLKLIPAIVDEEPQPLPQGRIQLLATFQEFDLPKDAQ